ncbi:PREDICTED: phytosulfokines 3-like [Populus euphratica]|uniref:Phytosulfokine n=1 Tax=Populus euphratica TaxID=75702 RepID=A0AAJ6XUB5_POPEU|nr:PREDICTED: phytosulfokines 3-like [Populus euphratica]XP_011031319.1 PREDICTED: phytosulfokines 3-like [Populus euphratica]
MANFKVTTLFLIVSLLLCSTLTYAARPEPGFPNGSLTKNQQKVVDAEHAEVMEESCEGVGEEECLMRRTLAAHTDYIYTQKHKP